MNTLSSYTVWVTTRIAQLATINLTALFIFALGLGIFGVAPAVVASLWATRRIESHTAGALARGMLIQARAEAMRANLVAGLSLVIVGALGAFASAGGALAPVFAALAVVSAIHALAALVTLSLFSGSIWDGIANAVTALALIPYRLLACVLVVPFIVLLVLWQPLLGLYAALSGWALAVNLITIPGLASAMPDPMTHKEALT